MKNFFSSLLTIIIILLITLQLPFSFQAKPTKRSLDYEYVMRDALKNKNPYVTKVAMLGAHDALSEGIKYNSKAAEGESGIVVHPAAKILAKGLIVRMSRTQNADAKELLYSGVRYLDVRITKSYGDYYTYHAYLSGYLRRYLIDVVEFLETHEGEFIIFDIQHFLREEKATEEERNAQIVELINYIGSIKTENGHSLLDFVYYNAHSNSLSELRYNDVTENGTKGGVIILTKGLETEYSYRRDSDASYEDTSYYSIRSYWHDTNNTKEMLLGINDEYLYILNHQDLVEGKFVINQAQKTAFQANKTMVRSLFGWSVLDMNARFNKKAIRNKDFSKWLSVMPIYMVDSATSRKGNFNKRVNELIISYNEGLE